MTETPLSYETLPDALHSLVDLPNFPKATIFALNENLAAEFNLDTQDMRGHGAAALLRGQDITASPRPLAMAYAGHQFAHFTPSLGDGRAMLLAEIQGRDGLLYDLHLKGSGRTPFSRGGDGLATLGSTLREYIMSEAMGALGVPTSRSLAALLTGQDVWREQAFSGAVLMRTARSMIRVGTFQYAAVHGGKESLRALADFSIARLFPEYTDQGEIKYHLFLTAVAQRQAELIANWMLKGFIHGVMNTDNVAISGETIDYGPCAFMDQFHQSKVFSSIDRRGRYAWSRQPEIGLWNLSRLAEALMPLFGDEEAEQMTTAQRALADYNTHFQRAFKSGMAQKLGVDPTHTALSELFSETFSALQLGGVDFTRFFTALTRHVAGGPKAAILNEFSNPEPAQNWLTFWQSVCVSSSTSGDERYQTMRTVNPIRIARNHQVEAAIQSANTGQRDVFLLLNAALQHPYEEDEKFLDFEAAPSAQEEVRETFCGT